MWTLFSMDPNHNGDLMVMTRAIVKRTWRCDECNDGSCFVSRKTKGSHAEGDPGIPVFVMNCMCLCSPKSCMEPIPVWMECF